MEDGRGQEEYVRQILEAYRKTPGTAVAVRRLDRMLAAQLYQRGVSASVIENAFVLATARRLTRPADAPPHPTKEHAFGVDDDLRSGSYVPGPVLDVDHFSQALLGHSCPTPKRSVCHGRNRP
jgi:hypothetical protein